MAMVLDYATLAAAELGNISDRRSYLLLEGNHGLPRLLTESSGLNSGFMIPQYTAAALVDRKGTRLNSSHVKISYAVFCLEKKSTCGTPVYLPLREGGEEL